MKTILALTLFFGCAINSFAQFSIATQAHNRTSFIGTYQVSDSWKLHTEAQFRREDVLAITPQQLLLRIAGLCSLSKDVSVGIGLGNIHAHPYGEQPIPITFTEHRDWQQLQFASIVNDDISLTNRYRFEERFSQSAEFSTSDNQCRRLYDFDLNYRIRYRFVLKLPLFEIGITKNHIVSLNNYDEYFVNFGPNTHKYIFEQNRLGA